MKEEKEVDGDEYYILKSKEGCERTSNEAVNLDFATFSCSQIGKKRMGEPLWKQCLAWLREWNMVPPGVEVKYSHTRSSTFLSSALKAVWPTTPTHLTECVIWVS